MKLVVGPDTITARRFAREMGDSWDGVAFSELLNMTGQRWDIIIIIQPLRIQVLTPVTLREYIHQHVKTKMTPGNERNIYVL